jgi:IS5 family transposase
VLDANTRLNFRNLLEKHEIQLALFAKVGELLLKGGLKLYGVTIVDATTITAPSSTKNEDKARDPEMPQPKKGNQRHIGMKVHIGVDCANGLVHSASITAANMQTARNCPTWSMDRKPGCVVAAPTATGL